MGVIYPLNAGAQAAFTVMPADRKPPEATRVTASKGAGGTDSDTGNLDKGADNTDIAANAKRMHRADREPLDRPAGPPPAFEVSILDQRLDFDRAIARMEARRGQALSEAAVQPSVQPSVQPAMPEPKPEPQPEPGPAGSSDLLMPAPRRSQAPEG